MQRRELETETELGSSPRPAGAGPDPGQRGGQAGALPGPCRGDPCCRPPSLGGSVTVTGCGPVTAVRPGPQDLLWLLRDRPGDQARLTRVRDVLGGRHEPSPPSDVPLQSRRQGASALLRGSRGMSGGRVAGRLPRGAGAVGVTQALAKPRGLMSRRHGFLAGPEGGSPGPGCPAGVLSPVHACAFSWCLHGGGSTLRDPLREASDPGGGLVTSHLPKVPPDRHTGQQHSSLKLGDTHPGSTRRISGGRVGPPPADLEPGPTPRLCAWARGRPGAASSPREAPPLHLPWRGGRRPGGHAQEPRRALLRPRVLPAQGVCVCVRAQTYWGDPPDEAPSCSGPHRVWTLPGPPGLLHAGALPGIGLPGTCEGAGVSEGQRMRPSPA